MDKDAAAERIDGALEDLYRSPSSRLVARLRRRFGDALAEDIAQDVQ